MGEGKELHKIQMYLKNNNIECATSYAKGRGGQTGHGGCWLPFIKGGVGDWSPFIKGVVVGTGHHSSRVLLVLGPIHAWWLLVHCCMGVVPGQHRVVILGCCHHRVVVGSWPGLVFHSHVVLVVMWSVSIILCCLVIYHGHSQVVLQSPPCCHLLFGCHSAISDMAPDSDVKKQTQWRGHQCSPGCCPSWSLPDIAIHCSCVIIVAMSLFLTWPLLLM